MKPIQLFIVVALAFATTIVIYKDYNKSIVSWEDSVYNPDNAEFVEECAFNLDKNFNEVTQEDFNNRYLN